MSQPYLPEEKELFQHIGVLLILLQDVEFWFSKTLKLCFPGKNGINRKKLFSEDRRTMERFVKELKKRTELDPEFAGILKKLIEDRNFFVHRMRHQEWFDTLTEEGRDSIWRFLMELQEGIQTVSMTLQIVIQNETDCYRFATPEVLQALDEGNHFKYWAEHAELASRAIKRKSQPAGGR